MAKRTCQIVGCEQKHRARGFCYNHYTQARIRGDIVTRPRTQPQYKDTTSRFMAKVDQDGPNGCWMWLAAKTQDGYGMFGVGKQPRPAHRVSYELFVEPIPEGLQIDHLCRTPSCVNPRHLDPVTPRVNTLRGFSPTSLNARKTHCIHGHEFTPENTWIDVKRNGRSCRACWADRKAAAKAAKQTTLTTRRAT